MNELLRERLIRLLSEPTQVTNEEMQNAYGQFTANMEAVSNSDDYAGVFGR